MDKIAVIGAGTMGSGIAQVFAMAGFAVSLTDSDTSAAQRGLESIFRSLDRQIKKGTIDADFKEQTLLRIEIAPDLPTAVSDARTVIEAVPEVQELKSELFRRLDEITPFDCLLLSNTSSISITRLAAETRRPDRVAGMHFMNPVPLMPLVEVVRGQQTSQQTADRVIGFARELGKEPVLVRDFPGFVANRILMPMINEAVYTLQEGVAGIAEIDAVMKLGMSHPMGPLLLADYIGLDVCLSILRVLHEGFGQPKYAPAPLLVNLVQAGRMGAKSGRGFYRWSDEGKAIEPAVIFG